MHFRPPEEQNDHKVTCGVQTGPLPRVLERISKTLEKGGVDCNVITSGTGGARRCLGWAGPALDLVFAAVLDAAGREGLLQPGLAGLGFR
jgi:hypothetical protein